MKLREPFGGMKQRLSCLTGGFEKSKNQVHGLSDLDYA
jgi:hypothetical protein